MDMARARGRHTLGPTGRLETVPQVQGLLTLATGRRHQTERFFDMCDAQIAARATAELA
jgi:hypothetical protein